jgi:TldD protein
MPIINLKPYAGMLSEYTELRIQENKNLNISYLKGNLVQNTKNSSGGVSARVCKSGSWGFASSPEINEENISKIIQTAKNNAAFLDSRENRNLPSFMPSSPVEHRDFGTKKSRLSQGQIMEFIQEVDNHISKKYTNLSNRSLALRCLDMEKTLLTSDGASLYSLIPRTNIIIELTLEKDGQPVELYTVFGGLGQFEDNFTNPEDLYERIENLYNHLVNKSEGVYASAGMKDCVMDSRLAGILAHEAIGHTTEADIVLAGSVAGEYLGKQVSSDLITLVDFAHSYDGKNCPVPIYIDDEGTKAEDTVIIEKGVLKSFMHSKATAQHFNTAPTGNARAYQYFDEPLVRMRNTAILPGQSKVEDMIASIEDGYYLMQPSNGQADTTSEFMFGVTMGYEIKNGKLGKAIKDTTISGVAFDVLKTVTMVSDDMTWSSGGMCGKKQMITVGMGGPAIKSKINIGGR